jgi:hypothetical protein
MCAMPVHDDAACSIEVLVLPAFRPGMHYNAPLCLA